jgi:hypothetical protein
VRPGASGVEIALLESVALAGRVVDDRGEALRMFRVEARSVAALGAERPRDVIARDSFLSPDGRFVLDGLHAGRWDVVASALGHVSPVGRRVDVPADPAFELRLVRRAHLSGVVVDARGRPIAGAKVTLASLPQGPSLAPDSDAATSAADGRFLLETAPGAVTVRATVQGLAPSPDLELDVAAGERRSDLLLHVPDGGRIVGYVLDGDGNPADGWRVVVADENGRSAGSARTNGDGSFLLGPLVARTYTVRLASRNATRPVARDRVEARVVEGGTVEVRLGGRSEGATRVHGIVRCGGAPIARMTVTAWSDDDLSGRAATETDDGGRYELELLPGAHRLSVYGRRGDDGHVSLTLSVEVEGGTELRRDVDLPSGAISGRVLDDDGSPLENVALSVEEEHGATPFQASGNAAPDGTFSLECLPAGTYRLSVDGWRARRRAWIFRGGIVVGEGTRVEGLELRARPSCAVDGIVRDPAGGPLLGVEVFARGEDGELGPSPARCDAAGRFSVRDLPPGRTTFFARDASRASVEGSAIELTPDRRGDVELVLGPGTALDVEVAEADTSKCFVRVFDATGREVAREGSDKRPIAVLPPGTYRIVGTDDRGASAEASASLGGQAQSTVSLSFER